MEDYRSFPSRAVPFRHAARTSRGNGCAAAVVDNEKRRLRSREKKGVTLGALGALVSCYSCGCTAVPPHFSTEGPTSHYLSCRMQRRASCSPHVDPSRLTTISLPKNPKPTRRHATPVRNQPLQVKSLRRWLAVKASVGNCPDAGPPLHVPCWPYAVTCTPRRLPSGACKPCDE